jgi:hypothetical protein
MPLLPHGFASVRGSPFNLFFLEGEMLKRKMHENRRFLTALALSLILSAASSKGEPDCRPARTPRPPSYTLTEIGDRKIIAVNSGDSAGDIAGVLDAGNGVQHACITQHGRVIDIGVLLGPTINSQAQNVNRLGHATISSDTGGYLYKHGQLFPIVLPQGIVLVALIGLNDFGEIVGLYSVEGSNSGETFGFLLKPNGTFVTLTGQLAGQPSGLRPGNTSFSVDLTGNYIDDLGEIFGAILNAPPTPGAPPGPGFFGAGLREPNGTLVSLTTDGEAFAINNIGHVCGSLGFNAAIFKRGKVITLPDLPNTPASTLTYFPTAINDFDEVAGWAGQINVFETQGFGRESFVYINGHGYDLDAAIYPQKGFMVSNVVAITDWGQITVTGGYSEVFEPNDFVTAILTPRFEPRQTMP